VALRDDPEPTLWHDRLARLRARQADRALWLAGQPRAARHVALRLWNESDTLTLTDTQAIVAGVVSGRGDIS
jgi:hypothetical protein